MAAAKYDLKVEQGSTLQFQMGFIKDGQTLALDEMTFSGEIKNSVYDRQGFPFRFVKGIGVVDVYLDSEVSALMDFDAGVYDIVIHFPDDRDFRLLQGKVSINFGVTI